MVCSGWLRKSPPEKKLRRYVSTVLIVFKCTQTAELLAQDSCKCTVCFLKTAGQSILHDRTHKGLAFALCVLKNVFKIRFSPFKYTRVCERGLWRFEQLCGNGTIIVCAKPLLFRHHGMCETRLPVLCENSFGLFIECINDNRNE